MTLSLSHTFRSNKNSMNGTSDPRWDKEHVLFYFPTKSVKTGHLSMQYKNILFSWLTKTEHVMSSNPLAKN